MQCPGSSDRRPNTYNTGRRDVLLGMKDVRCDQLKLLQSCDLRTETRITVVHDDICVHVLSRNFVNAAAKREKKNLFNRLDWAILVKFSPSVSSIRKNIKLASQGQLCPECTVNINGRSQKFVRKLKSYLCAGS